MGESPDLNGIGEKLAGETCLRGVEHIADSGPAKIDGAESGPFVQAQAAADEDVFGLERALNLAALDDEIATDVGPDDVQATKESGAALQQHVAFDRNGVGLNWGLKHGAEEHHEAVGAEPTKVYPLIESGRADHQGLVQPGVLETHRAAKAGAKYLQAPVGEQVEIAVHFDVLIFDDLQVTGMANDGLQELAGQYRLRGQGLGVGRIAVQLALQPVFEVDAHIGPFSQA